MAAFVIIGFSVDNHFRGEDFVHNDSIAFDVEDDVQLFVACAQLLGVGMIMADGTIATFRNEVGKIAQGHDFRTQFAGILGSMFKGADADDKVGNVVDVGKNRVKDSYLVLFQNLSSTACSNFSTNSSTVCSRSLGVEDASLSVS